MLRWSLSALAAVLVMTNVSYGLVTLGYTQNPDPGPGYKSYTVQATGTGINVLGSFVVTGDVHQVWLWDPMASDYVQSEWLQNSNGNTPGDPMDSHVVFGDERLADLANILGGPYGPVVTWETNSGANPGGMLPLQGLGTLNNGGLYMEMAEGDAPPDVGPMIPGDANGDGLVDEPDIMTLAVNWYVTSATWAQGDFDGDGLVGPADASILAAQWSYGLAEMGDSAGDGSDGPYPDGAESAFSGFADAYLSFGSPSQTETTVDLLKLVVPDGGIVTVELALYTAELDSGSGFFEDITQYEFYDESALVIPEPSTLVLLGLGVLGLVMSRFRRK